MEELSNIKKRVRDDSDESDFDSPEVKKLRDDLLDCLDDSDLGSTSPDLDSFMKSFEEEITASNHPPPPPPPPEAAIVVDLRSDSGESQPELGYLLEASDDELGLPPSTTPSSEVDNNNNNKGTEVVRVASESWFDDQIPSYDSYEFGIGNDDNNGEYVPFDNSLFDNSDLGDFPDIWFPTTLPAQ